MKKIFSLVAVAFALVLTGCDDVQVSTRAGWGVDRISFGHSYGRGWDYRDHMHRRQRHWRDHNDRYWGRNPGWSRRPGWSHGRRNDWRRRGIVAENLVVASAPSAPALSKQDLAVYSAIGKNYGIGPKTSTRVLESLNRAAVGDFGGLTDLGLTKNSLASAERNNGRLAAAELDRLSRKLGVSQQKLDSMIQDVLSKR